VVKVNWAQGNAVPAPPIIGGAGTAFPCVQLLRSSVPTPQIL